MLISPAIESISENYGNIESTNSPIYSNPTQHPTFNDNDNNDNDKSLNRGSIDIYVYLYLIIVFFILSIGFYLKFNKYIQIFEKNDIVPSLVLCQIS